MKPTGAAPFSSSRPPEGNLLLQGAMAVLGFAGAAALCFIPTVQRSLAVLWFYQGSYYLMLLLAAAWALAVWTVLREERPDIRGFLKENTAGVVLSILMTMIVFLSAHSQFRLLSDETNLLAVSKSMLYDKHTANVTQGKWFHFNFYAEEYQPEKRPFLYPLCIYFCHVLLGFRDWNPFLVNALALAGMLFLVFVFLRRRLGIACAAAGMILVIAQPVVTQTAASAGMDMMAAFCMAAALMSLGWFLEKPGASRFLLVWFQLLLLAHTRYEGPLYFAVIVAALAWKGLIRLSYFRSSWLYTLTPLFFVVTYWQRVLMPTDLQTPEGVAPFGLSYFVRHNMDFFKTFFRFDFLLPYAPIVNFLGLLCLAAGAFRLFSRPLPSRTARIWAFTAAAMLGTYWVVVNAHFGGFALMYDGVRLMVPAVVVLSVACAWGMARLRGFHKRPFFLVAAALTAFLIYHPMSIENRGWNAVILTREYRFVSGFLEKQPSRNFLVVAYRSGIYTARDWGAVSVQYANLHKKELLAEKKQHLYRDIFVIQEIDLASGQPVADTVLDPEYRLEPLLESQRQMPGVTKTRISKVIN